VKHNLEIFAENFDLRRTFSYSVLPIWRPSKLQGRTKWSISPCQSSVYNVFPISTNNNKPPIWIVP